MHRSLKIKYWFLLKIHFKGVFVTELSETIFLFVTHLRLRVHVEHVIIDDEALGIN